MHGQTADRWRDTWTSRGVMSKKGSQKISDNSHVCARTQLQEWKSPGRLPSQPPDPLKKPCVEVRKQTLKLLPL